MSIHARLVVITDRRRYASEAIAGRVAAILAATPRGSVMIQVRENDLDGRPLLRLVREVLEVAQPAGAPVWVNDRADVARIAGAQGVHLPERGLTIADARAAAPGLAIGCSRHTQEAAAIAAREGAELVHLGPIFATPGKSDPIGIEALRFELPARLVAVGGIDTAERALAAARAGAAAVAVIRAAWTADDPGALLAAMVAAVDEGRAAQRLTKP